MATASGLGSASRALVPAARALVLATHAMPTVAVTGFCAATAAAVGLSPGRTGLLAAAVLAGQASVGWMNDWVDTPRDRRAGRLDKPVVRGEVGPTALGVAAVAAAATALALSLALGARPAAVHLTALSWAWAYNGRLKATPGSPAPYVVAFGLVPAVLVASALPGSPLPRWPFPLAGSALGAAGHFANAVGDEAADALTAVRGLPQRLGPTRSTAVSGGLVVVGAGFLLAGTGPVAVALGTGVAAAVVAAASLVAVARGRRSRLAFRLAVLAAGLLVVGFVAAGGSRLVAAHACGRACGE